MSLREEKATSLPIANVSLATVVVFVTVWLTAFMGVRPFMLPDEGRYAGVAWEMLTSGNWLVPQLDGLPFFHKPPLFYWFSASSMKLLGEHEWAARLPSALGGIAAVVAVYLFVKRYRNSRAAIATVAITVTQPFFYGGAQFANLDMLVAGMISLTILSGADALLRIENRLSWRRLPLARTFLLAALGVLAKGLIGVVLPGAVLCLWLMYRRAWKLAWTAVWLPGYLVFFLVAVPWFAWMQHLYPGFFDYFFVYQHFTRFLASNFNNQQPFWFYLPVILSLTLPWSFWLYRSLAAKGFWKSMAKDSIGSLMIIWFLVIVIFFSLPASKLIGYVLPATIPFSFFIAEIFAAWHHNEQGKARHRFLVTFGIAGAICVGAVLAIVIANKHSAKPMATEQQRAFGPNDQLVMVGVYQYDLPFYLQAATPSWVVLDWADPKIPKADRWEKELFDAGKFDPEKAQAILIEPSRLSEKLCNFRSGAVWFWGTDKSYSVLPWLKNLPRLKDKGSHFMWRLTPTAITNLPLCAEKPTGG